MISRDELEHVLFLARLAPSEDEKEKLKKDLEDILNMVNVIMEVDTEGVEPMTYPVPPSTTPREDVVSDANTIPREEFLKVAPKTSGKYVLVPRVVE